MKTPLLFLIVVTLLALAVLQDYTTHAQVTWWSYAAGSAAGLYLVGKLVHVAVGAWSRRKKPPIDSPPTYSAAPLMLLLTSGGMWVVAAMWVGLLLVVLANSFQQKSWVSYVLK